jgi:CHAT domain-containing protein/predicted negative regulator of RcsB-dependent stress response
MSDARMSLERAVISPDNAGTLGWLGRLLNARRIARSARALTLGAVALSVTIFLLAPVIAVSANEVPAGTLFDQGVKAFARGAFAEAASSWSGAAAAYEREQNRSAQITALVHLAQAQSALGQYRQAVGSLGAALELAEQLGDLRRIASIVAGLGNAHIALGPPETAAMYLDRALGASRQTGDSTLTASILNNRGNLLVTQEKNAEAIAAYKESAEIAKQAGQPLLRARALTNAATTLRRTGAAQESRDLLDAASDELRGLEATSESAFAWINVGLAYRDLRPSLPASGDQLLLRAAGALTEAAVQADKIGDRRTASYAWGYLGNLYEIERRNAEALELTRRAILAAQQANAPESLYRWQWQAGRLLKKLGSVDDAIASYRRSVYTLQTIRQELSVGYGAQSTSFRETVGPVYFELVDLLLQRAAVRSRDQAAPYLIEARETVELFKAAELRDYFRDDCVDTALSKVTKLDVVSQTAVVVYPILLPDRTELLVSLPSGLKRVSVPVGIDRITQEVRQFRRRLEKRTTREYLPHAQQLYDWLMRPLEADFKEAGIDTLVFVPDGPLRTIPMAALHDGKQFLISKYAMAITPGLSLTDPRPIKREGAKMLAVGVTEAVQGFPPLPYVAAELEALRTIFPTTTLVDKEFVLAKFEEALKQEQYSILHIASHGEFSSEPGKTFLLAFDGKLTMDRLDSDIGLFKFRDDPLELLTLSACDTAEGDDRAALGLAGVAIKAGARSALATLWEINDVAAAGLIADFYRGLQDASISRAKALQRAQVKMLGDARYEHPGFWSPFLLINNWL